MAEFIDIYESPFGSLTIRANDHAVTGIGCFIEQDEELELVTNEITERCRAELAEYFDGERCEFSVPVEPEGTDYQKRVWAEAVKIPYGSTISYGELAERVGNPKGARSVGHALGRNPILLIIPCHRIIGAGGALTGFAAGLPFKASLLAMEQWNTKHEF